MGILSLWKSCYRAAASAAGPAAHHKRFVGRCTNMQRSMVSGAFIRCRAFRRCRHSRKGNGVATTKEVIFPDNTDAPATYISTRRPSRSHKPVAAAPLLLMVGWLRRAFSVNGMIAAVIRFAAHARLGGAAESRPRSDTGPQKGYFSPGADQHLGEPTRRAGGPAALVGE